MHLAALSHCVRLRRDTDDSAVVLLVLALAALNPLPSAAQSSPGTIAYVRGGDRREIHMIDANGANDRTMWIEPSPTASIDSLYVARSPGVLRSDPPGLHTAVMDTGPRRVVLDTNVFVAAGFNPGSHSARLVDAVRDGRLRLVWDDATHTEIEHVIRRIPRLSWTRIADLFRPEERFGGSTHPEAFGFVPDPADRKFAALAQAAHAPLVTSDAGLLNAAGHMAVPVLKPSEFARRCDALNREPGLHEQSSS